ncbi:MAG: hypothetical protein QN141_02620 [Armatimonadota bacterium]|nr:hypothetical protein [Armatimonadota bacterium]MDR7450794.1 hypothetical protein [Armatimonadota bacterium]MDR7466150.1 hypothetical protein [Armatimonadota bacterium]MDR7493813.1 hypothetical protein [Armatimonadota bacterium]MDR7499026.1 hypothetical protein [Armatimonadota bacterium]
MPGARRILSGILVAVVMSLLLTHALPGSQSRKVEVTGVILSVGVASAEPSFQVREFSTNAVWSVVLRRDAEIEFKSRRMHQPYDRLSVGDIVEVEGRRTAPRTILAREVKVLGHTAAEAGPAPQQPAAPGLTAAAVIKTIGIGAAVKAFAPAINTFINTLVQARDPTTLQSTKVVPILSISIGINAPGEAAVGAAQVSGPKAAVEKVQAVAAIDANYQGSFSIRALVPVDSLEPWKQVRRVPGVGVSAIIDLRL